ncbi:winged helix-turn-helix domain-containing protein [Yokenella regensburgei]|uniref:winged helix-turn-helix domain-containing protein n=1 Tax=Yokenella regensburgei TaxID=158877 RepID=UPI003F16220A
MNKTLFGYIIGQDIQLDLIHKHLINVSGRSRPGKRDRIPLRDTKLRLLMFLLAHGGKGVITTQRLMSQVWDKHGLRSSAPRLWQVMQDLKLTLSMIGIEDDFIIRVDNRGYQIKADIVTALYCENRQQSEDVEKNRAKFITKTQPSLAS